jgi:hypothetical protein
VTLPSTLLTFCCGSILVSSLWSMSIASWRDWTRNEARHSLVQKTGSNIVSFQGCLSGSRNRELLCSLLVWTICFWKSFDHDHWIWVCHGLNITQIPLVDH